MYCTHCCPVCYNENILEEIVDWTISGCPEAVSPHLYIMPCFGPLWFIQYVSVFWLCTLFFLLFLLQVVMPYIVATKMSKIRKGNMLAPSPETFVCSALNTVGLQSCTFGYWFHAVQVGPFWMCSVFNIFTASRIGQPSVPDLEQMMLLWTLHIYSLQMVCVLKTTTKHRFLCVLSRPQHLEGAN